MKKIVCLFVAIFSCVFLTGTLQANQVTKQAVSFQTVATTKSSSNAYYPTDIMITNYSSRYVDIYVPVLKFTRRLYPHYTQHILAYDADPKRVVLYDYNGIVFMDRLVDNHEDIHVYDRLGKTFVK